MPQRILLLAATVVLAVSAAFGGTVTSAAATPLPKSDARVVGHNPALTTSLRAIVRDADRPLSGLAVLAVQNGRVTYTGNFGRRLIVTAKPGLDRRVDKDTKFRIASISKLVAAVGVMQQVEKGAIDLDADVSTYLGFTFRNPNFPGEPITPRMLLSHTSSLRDGDYYVFPAADPLSDYLVPGAPHYEEGARWAAPTADAADVGPGRYFSYANLNYGVLATVLEAVSGERFDRYMKEHVLIPLGCQASYDVRDFNRRALRNVSVLYRKQDESGAWDPKGPWYPQVDDYRGVRPPAPEGSSTYVPGTNATWQSPQGGLRISAWDLSKVMRMFLNGGRFRGERLLKTSTVNTMFKPAWTYSVQHPNGDTYWDLMLCYGMGPHILTNTLGDRLLADRNVWMAGHLGEAYGLLSGMMMDFGSRDGFIYLIGGLGADPDENFGDYSTFYMWEEQIITATFRHELLK